RDFHVTGVQTCALPILRTVAKLLIDSGYTISEAAFAAGFNDIKYFREQFSKLFGMKPSDYKRKYGKREKNPLIKPAKTKNSFVRSEERRVGKERKTRR